MSGLPVVFKVHPLEELRSIVDRPEIGTVHAVKLLDALGELKHLREHLPRVQGVASRERDRRMVAEKSREVAEVARDALALAQVEREAELREDAAVLSGEAELREASDTLVEIVRFYTGSRPSGRTTAALCEAALDATVRAVRVVAPPSVAPAHPAPKPKKTLRWLDLEAKISRAVDAGEDPDPADMAALLEEQTSAAGAS